LLEADQPNIALLFRDADVLSGKDLTYVDLLGTNTDSPALGDGDGAVVKRAFHFGYFRHHPARPAMHFSPAYSPLACRGRSASLELIHNQNSCAASPRTRVTRLKPPLCLMENDAGINSHKVVSNIMCAKKKPNCACQFHDRVTP